jgi:hypothetical protein
MRRPYSVTLLAIGVLTLALAGLVRAGQTIRLWTFLNTLEVSPGYLLTTGLLTGLAGLLAVWGLWRGTAWSPRYTTGYISTLLVFYWIDRIWMTQSQTTLVNTPFAIGISLLIALLTAWALYSKSGKSFFSKFSFNAKSQKS